MLELFRPPVRPGIHPLPALPGGPALAADPRLLDSLRDLVATLPLPEPAEIRPTLGFEVGYRQVWTTLGYRRGRLLRSIPLTADARKEISVKTWAVRKRRREENQSVENDISTEIVGDEKWTHAATKQLSADLNQSIDSNMKVSATVPVPPASINVERGNAARTAGAVKGSITDTEERVHQATVKVTDALRRKVSSTVETSEEAGFEETVRDTIVNPNKCNTLTYHFFEITERHEVATQLESIVPVLLVPLADPVITPAWLLAHECLLREHLPCEAFYAGFDAARAVAAQDHLGQFAGDLDSDQVKAASAATLAAVEAVLSAYLSLAGSTIIPAGTEDADPGAMQRAISGLGTALTQLQDLLDGPDDGDDGDDGEPTVDDVIETVEQAGADLVEAFGDFIGSLFGGEPAPQARAAGGPSVLAVQANPGAFGSWLYWQVAQIAAPELGSALAGLNAAYATIDQMPEGPAKVDLLAGAVQNFVAALGDIDALFTKIDLGIAVVALVLAGTAAAQIAAVTALIGLVGGLTAAAAAALVLGVVASAALAEVAFSIVALILSGDVLDLLPDDRGLQQAIGALAGVAAQLGQAVALPQAPQSDDPKVVAAYQQDLQQARRQRVQLAEAQVELNRLVDHIQENKSHYAEVVWSAVPAADLERRLQIDHAIPAHVVEPRITGFAGGRAAFRIRDPEWFGFSGIKLTKTVKELAEQLKVKRKTWQDEITLPTRA